MKEEIIPILINIGKFIGILILAWIVLKIVLSTLKKVLKASRVDVLSDKLNEAEIFGENFKIKLSKILLLLVKWIYIVVVTIAVSNYLGLDILSQQISSILNYLPKLLSASIMFLIGIYAASIVRNSLRTFLKSIDVNGSNLIGNIAFFTIAVLVGLTSLDQAGMQTEIIKDYLKLILSAFLFAFAVALGLGSRDVVKRLLYGFYSRKNIEIGDHIEFNNTKGIVIGIDNICIILRTTEGKVIIPIEELVNSKITLINNENKG
jgi:uncharacterized membrane protein